MDAGLACDLLRHLIEVLSATTKGGALLSAKGQAFGVLVGIAATGVLAAAQRRPRRRVVCARRTGALSPTCGPPGWESSDSLLPME